MENDFPSRLALARALAGLTQSELAEVSGLSKPQISKYELGHARPRLGAVVKLANALHTSIEWLRTGEAEDQPVPKLTQPGLRLMDKEIAFDIPREAEEKILKICADTGQTFAEVVRTLVLDALKDEIAKHASARTGIFNR